MTASVAYLEKRAQMAQEALDRALEREARQEEAKARFESLRRAKTGTTVRFVRTFQEGGMGYTYAAVKAGRYWYITGRSQKGYMISFEELVSDFLAPADTVEVMKVKKVL